MALSSVLGLSIQRSPFSETSQVVQFLTREHGRVSCMIKGAFRDKNGYQGCVDLLVLSEFTMTRRRGQSLALLRKRKLVDHYPGLRSDVERFAAASLVGELLRRGVQDGQRIPGLFNLATRVLSGLEQGRDPVPGILFVFQGAFLKMLGYEPTLSYCLECRKRPSPGHRLTIYPGRGGLLCRQCRGSASAGVSLSFETARMLSRAAAGELPALNRSGPTARLVREGLVFYETFFQYYLEKKVSSFAFIKSLESLP